MFPNHGKMDNVRIVEINNSPKCITLKYPHKRAVISLRKPSGDLPVILRNTLLK